MEENIIEQLKELLKKHTENVSVNYWINAIHEDKIDEVAEEAYLLFRKCEGENNINTSEPQLPQADVSGSVCDCNHQTTCSIYGVPNYCAKCMKPISVGYFS